ncbi:hypothetical protein ZTR_03536 [Talaromyces verruculosus]|nr:hypothetical protein ZTR_03536 [Talaromyces verruculosus]
MASDSEDISFDKPTSSNTATNNNNNPLENQCHLGQEALSRMAALWDDGLSDSSGLLNPLDSVIGPELFDCDLNLMSSTSTWQPAQKRSQLKPINTAHQQLVQNSLFAESLQIPTADSNLATSQAIEPYCLSKYQPASNDPLTQLRGLFLKTGHSECKSYGAVSLLATISMCISSSPGHADGDLEPRTTNHFAQSAQQVSTMEMPKNPYPEKPSLPDLALVERSLAAYFNHIHFRFPIVDVTLRTNWPQLYADLNLIKDPISLSRLYLVISIGALTTQPVGRSQEYWEKISTLQQSAWSNIGVLIACPSLDSVEILLLHTIYLIFNRKPGIAWTVCGLGVRIAQSLGLHQDIPAQLHSSGAQSLRRSRLWDVAFALDAFLSLSEGQPPVIACQDSPKSTTILTTSECDTELEVNNTTAISVHRWHVELSIIANRFLWLLNRPSTMSSQLEEFSALDEELLQWRDQIPMDARPEQEILVCNELYSTVAWLHVQYFNLMRSLHYISSTVLAKFLEKDICRCAARVRASNSICASSARSLVKIYNKALVETKHTVDLTAFPIAYCMAALAVIFQNIMKNPHLFSARTDLEYLRAGTVLVVQAFQTPGELHPLGSLFLNLKQLAEAAVQERFASIT